MFNYCNSDDYSYEEKLKYEGNYIEDVNLPTMFIGIQLHNGCRSFDDILVHKLVENDTISICYTVKKKSKNQNRKIIFKLLYKCCETLESNTYEMLDITESEFKKLFS